jgi:hypothetical protein
VIGKMARTKLKGIKYATKVGIEDWKKHLEFWQ